jgi:molybdate transport system substrate-binding protein
MFAMLRGQGDNAICGKICGARLGWALTVLLLGAAAPVRAAEYPVAPDVVVFCEPTLQRAVGDVGALWRARAGIKVRVFTSPTPALLAQIAHHARDDVLIGEGDDSAAAAAQRQLIKPGSLRRVWRNRLVVAGLRGTIGADGVPPSPAAPKLAAVAGKEPIAIVDPWAATAGADSRAVLQSLGLWRAVGGKSVGTVDSADAAFLLDQHRARLALIYATDVAAEPALAIADSLPPDSYPKIVYWVAETQHALSPNAARFIAFLREPQARQQLRADGLEVLP